MLALYRATLVRAPVPVRTLLVVVAVYGTMYATWRPHATWGRLGHYAPTYARIPIDEQFGLELLGGTRVPRPNADKVAGPWSRRPPTPFGRGQYLRETKIGNAMANYIARCVTTVS